MATTTQESGSRWRPAIPLWALASGRAFMALLDGLGLGIVTGILSALTRTGMTIDRVVAFAIVAAVIREVLDATASRLIMRAKRSQDPEGAILAVISLICPALAGFAAAKLLASTSILTLTLVTWIFYMVIIITLEKPWDTTLNHEEMMRRTRQVRLMTREHFAEEIQDGRLSFQEVDDEGYYIDEDGNRIEEDD
ncbi:hypothetical protein [Actinomyces glycerinitolerans]|uniref:Uncharacterized protein n=1 Tax=Actinomyces glycerinitolerans TaxID=1892869 RepID=A0A1M4RY78_9ACTO|nr:hypothetical protein [Actinomyces glycerinitolerans]SHE24891.1 Hypothetical protein ACGLYG10_1101 [Actinomyces glycerinitolerans]